MHVSEFDYSLPPELIAQEPLPERSGSRMLVVDRRTGQWQDRRFTDFPEYLGPGDCVVVNNSKVFPSRLFGRRSGVRSLPIGKKNPARHEHLTKRVEVFLLQPVSDDWQTWRALVRPGKRMRIGERIEFEGGLEAEITEWGDFGERTIRFSADGAIMDRLWEIGHMPLPPYIKRPDVPQDRDRYQTVFAHDTGSVAAPTAGLHFTHEILGRCRAQGADIAEITLHVGLGTFQPLHSDVVEEVSLHEESWRISAEAAAKLAAARRIMAVGTTSVRTLETAVRLGPWRGCAGETGIFIYPGFSFQAVGAMLTNFHLPQSSLLLLVCAFAGKDLALAAYRHAVDERYRFFSYGDCMLIL